MIKKLIRKLKTSRLYSAMFSYNGKNEYVQYGTCPGFTICFTTWKKGGGCIMGHMWIKENDTNEIISKKLTELVVKICKEHDLSEEQTVKVINYNLKMNGLL